MDVDTSKHSNRVGLARSRRSILLGHQKGDSVTIGSIPFLPMVLPYLALPHLFYCVTFRNIGVHSARRPPKGQWKAGQGKARPGDIRNCFGNS